MWSEARFGSDMAWSTDGKLLITAPGGKSGHVFVYGDSGLVEIEVEGVEDGDRLGEMAAWVGEGGSRMAVNSPRDSLGSKNRPDEEEYGSFRVMTL